MLKKLGLLAILALPFSAHAAIVLDMSTTTTVGYWRGDGPVTSVTLPSGPANLYQYSTSDQTPGNLFNLNVSVSSVAENGGFAFEHNLYVQGDGGAGIDTIVTVRVTNTSDAAVSLRFDSLIDPGHIAARGANNGASSFFQFTVAQDGQQLFNVNGSQLAGYVDPQDLPFAGLNKFVDSNPSNPAAAGDWSATPLNVDLLSIAAGATSLVTYETRTGVADADYQNQATCADLATCYGTQVAFGDPLRNGGVTGLRSFATADLTPSRTDPVIGMQFNPYFVPISIVQQDSPLPPAPALLPPPNYALSSAVPEPATWAAMLAGFGAVGVGMRRRKSAVA